MSIEIGTLVVVVLKARNLLDKHFYKQDVYTKVTFNGITTETQIDVKGGQHPEWDDEFRFSVFESSKKKARTLEVSCWSKESRTDEIVGKGEVDINETLKTGEFDDWVPLTITDGTQRGEVYLEMTFYAAGPPPAISRRPSKLDPATRLTRIPPAKPHSHGASQYHHAGLQAVLSSPSGSHLSLSPEVRAGRISPRSESPLPPLPEEAAPSPAAVPAILRPGAGRPSGGHSPQPPSAGRHSASPETSPHPVYQAFPPSSTPVPISPPHTHASIDATPEILRAGPSRLHAAAPHVQSPLDSILEGLPPGSSRVGVTATANQRSPQPAEHPLPSLPGYAPVSSPEPVPHLSSYTTAPQPQRLIPALPSTPHPVPTPSYSGSWQQHASGTSQPQHTLQPSNYSVDSIHTSPSPQTHPSPAAPPQHSLPPSTYSVDSVHTSPGPQGHRPLQPSTYNVDPASAPSFPNVSFPAPQVPAPSPVPSYSHPAYSAGQSAYYPYRPVPLAQHARLYPYNYPPPPRDPDMDVPVLLKKERYQKPLPLPDEPHGVKTPTPAHPVPTPSVVAPSSPPKHQRKPSHERDDERDRLLALAIEHEEDERRKTAKEQEELDREMARKLDVELNLADMEAEARAEETVVNSLQPSDMPGSWYRHRVEV